MTLRDRLVQRLLAASCQDQDCPGTAGVSCANTGLSGYTDMGGGQLIHDSRLAAAVADGRVSTRQLARQYARPARRRRRGHPLYTPAPWMDAVSRGITGTDITSAILGQQENTTW